MTLCCADCGLRYDDPAWVEAIVPDDVWRVITPEQATPGSGILCVNCIARRCVDARLEKVPVRLTAGPLESGDAFAHHHARCRRVFDEWLQPLGLLWWSVDIDYYDDSAEFPGGTGSGDSRVVARVWAQWEYLQAKIAINVPEVAQMDDDKLERVLVHELCHILVSEMRADPDACTDHEERTVTQLANAFIWTRNLARKAAQQ